LFKANSGIQQATLYQPTVLGALCSLDMTQVEETEVLSVVSAVLEVYPTAVRCSQVEAGHTPLRDAARNVTCYPSIIELLVQTDKKLSSTTDSSTLDTTPAVYMIDQVGLYPIDHLIKAVQQGWSNTALHSLEKLLKHLDTSKDDQPDAASPLVRLFSIGTSFGYLPGTLPTMRTAMESSTTDQEQRLKRILECTRTLLRWNPRLIYQFSKCTGCSPLHVAIRNYGNSAEIVRELIERDTSGAVMRHRNHYGDLPLHVACAVGVPMDILRLVLARTVMASSTLKASSGASTVPFRAEPNPLVWSINNSGYTPVDLEWIRHIEAGNGFFSHRSFYPLDSRGVSRSGDRLDAMYENLLRQAVDQVLRHQQTASSTAIEAGAGDEAPVALPSRQDATASAEESRPTGDHGLLWHRIFLVIRSSFHDLFSRSPFDLSGDILHQAAALSGPDGPTLPRPILELIWWHHPEQLERKDHVGKLPLHYALQLRQSRCHGGETSYKAGQEWKLWVQTLLCHGPQACRVPDKQGRLPLHCALDYPSNDDASESDDTDRIHEARNLIVKDLAHRYPRSVEMADPVSKLHPFMLAAANPRLSIETVYQLLRHSPGLIRPTK
jgi:hypothetical protein